MATPTRTGDQNGRVACSETGEERARIMRLARQTGDPAAERFARLVLAEPKAQRDADHELFLDILGRTA